MMKNISVLGSTGSIGTQALEVTECNNKNFRPVALSAGSNIKLFEEQLYKYKPLYASVRNESDAADLRKKFPDIKIFSGDEGLIEIATQKDIDTVLIALSGKAGLKPAVEAIKRGKTIALANKETMVTAGDYVMKLAKEYNVRILPVDSEHSAIFQCIDGKPGAKKLIITASGGPFLHSTKEEMQSANLTEALAHPRWKMGKKITVDSATLMNKGLEVIEAHHLFNFDYDDIKVVVHPQSYVHSAVEFCDGSIIAQIGKTSMHIPIQYALTYPERLEGLETESFDFVKAAKFEFFEPDYEKFPSLRLAIEAGKTGGTATVCLNAANEEAVYAFLNNSINFTDIYKVTKRVYDEYTPVMNPDIDLILSEDEKIRNKTKDLIKTITENEVIV